MLNSEKESRAFLPLFIIFKKTVPLQRFLKIKYNLETSSQNSSLKFKRQYPIGTGFASQ